jgi:CTP:molybdopterin cytidylyltransferase MocA
LAAGASHRFGTDNKLLANIGGKPLIWDLVGQSSEEHPGWVQRVDRLISDVSAS